MMIMRIFTLIMYKIVIYVPDSWGKWLRAQFGFTNHLALMCTSYPMRSSKNKNIWITHIYLSHSRCDYTQPPKWWLMVVVYFLQLYFWGIRRENVCWWQPQSQLLLLAQLRYKGHVVGTTCDGCSSLSLPLFVM